MPRATPKAIGIGRTIPAPFLTVFQQARNTGGGLGRFQRLRSTAAAARLAVTRAYLWPFSRAFGLCSISRAAVFSALHPQEMKHETARKMDDALNPVPVKLAVNSVTTKAN